MFQRLGESARIFANVNSDWLEYAPDVSADQLELFFTRVEAITPAAQPLIYRSSRRSIDQPFSRPQRVGSIQSVAEAAALAPDEQSFYYLLSRSGERPVPVAARQAIDPGSATARTLRLEKDAPRAGFF
jgi:hypothetical protein